MRMRKDAQHRERTEGDGRGMGWPAIFNEVTWEGLWKRRVMGEPWESGQSIWQMEPQVRRPQEGVGWACREQGGRTGAVGREHKVGMGARDRGVAGP